MKWVTSWTYRIFSLSRTGSNRNLNPDENNRLTGLPTYSSGFTDFYSKEQSSLPYSSLLILGASEVNQANLYCTSRTSVLGRLRDYLRLLMKRFVDDNFEIGVHVRNNLLKAFNDMYCLCIT